MLLLALAIHTIVRRIYSECEILAHRWQADGGIICGKIEGVNHALEIVQAEGKNISLLLQPDKTVAI